MIITDTLPAGLSPTAEDDTTINGWSISFAGQTVTATCSDVLAPDASYPDLVVTVAVAGNAPASATNTATVSGGGETNTSNDSASDPTTINPVADLTIAKSHVGDFNQGDAGDLYTINVSNLSTGATNGDVTVTDVLPDGLSPNGDDNRTVDGWTISFIGQTITATRSDVLAGQSSYGH